MVEITGDSECPNCKKSHPVTIDLDKLDVKPPTPSKVTNAGAQQQTMLEPEIKEVEKVVEKTVVPSDQPYYECKDCDSMHQNKNYKIKPNKKCTNCGSLNGPKNKGCKNCANKEFEDLSDDELKDLDIPDPEVHEDDHEHAAE